MEFYGWLAVLLLWIGWAAYWALSAMGRPKPSRTDRGFSFLAYRVTNLAAILLLLVPRWSDSWFNAGFLTPNAALILAGVIITAAGLGIAIWARAHLGAQWTGRVGVRDDHRLIRTGPYRFVRHPIYSGIVVAFLGAVVMFGDWRSLIAVAMMVAALWFKLKREERWMTEHFAGDYTAYRQQVAALIPGVL